MQQETSPGYNPKLQFNAEVEALFLKVYGTDRFQAICQALTCPSKHACVRVNTLQNTCQDVLVTLSKVLRGLPIAAASKLRMRITDLDEANEGTPCFEHPILKNIIIVQGGGPYQIDYLGMPGGFKEVIVSRKCGEAVLRGANVFVPGVLACSGHVEQGDTVAISVAIEHLDEKGDWVVGLTRGTIPLSEHGNAQLTFSGRAHCYIGKGRAVLSRTAMFRESHGVAVEMVDRVYNLPPLHGVLKGDIFLQNLPSIIAARVLDPQPGDTILDMCAAPGGKTTALAILMQDEGTIVAVDRSHNKVMDIKKLTEEMKITCVYAQKLDALKAVETEQSHSECFAARKNCCGNGQILECTAKEALLAPETGNSPGLEQDSESNHATACFASLPPCCEEGKEMQHSSSMKARKEEKNLKHRSKQPQNLKTCARTNSVKGFSQSFFDRVLLDPPCSALGLRPRLFAGEETIEGLRRHAIYQKRLFDQAVQLCRPGGVIVYSTCTINPGENEAVVRYVLDTYSCLSLVCQSPYLGEPGLTGTLDDGISCKELLREEEKHLVQRFDPSGPLDTIGFFIAKFQMNLAKRTALQCGMISKIQV